MEDRKYAFNLTKSYTSTNDPYNEDFDFDEYLESLKEDDKGLILQSFGSIGSSFGHDDTRGGGRIVIDVNNFYVFGNISANGYPPEDYEEDLTKSRNGGSGGHIVIRTNQLGKIRKYKSSFLDCRSSQIRSEGII